MQRGGTFFSKNKTAHTTQSVRPSIQSRRQKTSASFNQHRQGGVDVFFQKIITYAAQSLGRGCFFQNKITQATQSIGTQNKRTTQNRKR